MDLQRVTVLLAAFAAPSAACTFPFCPYGVLPYDGQTDVPSDVVIQLFDDQLPDVLPGFADYIELVHLDSGAEIPFAAEVDREAGRIDVIPDLPLANGVYELVVTSDTSRSAQGHWVSQSSRDTTIVSFTVGDSDAAPVAFALADEDVPDLVVAFSEPVLLDGMAFRVDGQPDASPLGYFEDVPYLVRVPTSVIADSGEVVLTQGTSADGAALPAGPVPAVGSREAFLGRAHCVGL